jgi:hypothetical protein
MNNPGENFEPTTPSERKVDQSPSMTAVKNGDLAASLWRHGSIKDFGQMFNQGLRSLLMLDTVMLRDDAVPAEFKKQVDAIKRVKQQVKKMVDDDTLDRQQGAKLEKLGNAFVTGNWPAFAQAVRELKDDKADLLSALGKIIKENTGDKDPVTVKGDTWIFSGKGVLGGKGQLHISAKDNKYHIADDKGKPLAMNEGAKLKAVKRFTAFIQDRFSAKLEKDD